MNLWKVDVDRRMLNPDSTEDDIKKLGGVFMRSEHKFKRYFEADCELTDNIHIVAVIAIQPLVSVSQCFTSQTREYSLLYC